MKYRCMLAVPVLFLLMVLAVSCNPDTNVEELVSADFTSGTRSLLVSLESFDKNDLYWKYSARKSLTDGGTEMLDGSGLRSGETSSYDSNGAVWIKSDGSTGLGSVTGFSQGLWDFTLYGYHRSGSAGSYQYSLAYVGECTAVSLRKGGANSVSIIVSPGVSEGSGTLKVDVDNITFDAFQPDSSGVATFTKEVTVTRVKDSSTQTPVQGTANEYSLVPGSYKVNVAFTYTIGTDKYIYAEGHVYAMVFSNLTSIVTGDLSELLTYAQFDASASYPGLPSGTLGVSVDGNTGAWKISFTSTNPEAVPTSFIWYVDSTFQGETGSSFTYTKGDEGVEVICIFGNGSGMGSASVTIN